MRHLPLLLLAALFLAGGLGWLLFSSDENEAVPIARLAEKAEKPNLNPSAEPMRAPMVSTRSEVQVSEEAKTKAKTLLDIRSKPPEEEPGPVGAVTVIVVDQEGNPVPGVHLRQSPIEIELRFVWKRQMTLATDAEGRARFEELPVGQHRFGIHLGLFVARLPRRQSNSDSNPETTQKVVGVGGGALVLNLGLVRRLIELNPLLNDSGYITTFVRANGEATVRLVVPKLHALAGIVRDLNGPLPKAVVRLYLDSQDAIDSEGGRRGIVSIPENPHEITTLTDEEGKFRFENLSQGDYAISVERPTGGMRQHWDFELPDHSAGVELILDDLSVHGYVTTPEGVPLAGVQLVIERVRLDEEGQPQPGESVRLDQSLYQAGTTQVATSDSDGSYLIEGVDGSRPLVVTARTPWKTTTRSRIFGFDEGEQQLEINVAMTTTGVVTARLFQRDGITRKYAIAATPINQKKPLTSLSRDTHGQATLHGLAPGRYLFEVRYSSNDPRRASHIPDPIEGEVVAGENLALEFIVP